MDLAHVTEKGPMLHGLDSVTFGRIASWAWPMLHRLGLLGFLLSTSI